MKIERFYYEESKVSDRLVEEEVEAKMWEMSEEERIRDKEQKLREAQDIAEMAEAKIDVKLKNISQERVEHFEKMAKKALRVAQVMFLNVEIDSEKGYVGTIEFTGNAMIMNEYLEKSVIQDFRDLMCSTEEIVIVPADKLMRIVFYYNLVQDKNFLFSSAGGLKCYR